MKCISYVLLSALLLIASFTVYSGNAHAITELGNYNYKLDNYYGISCPLVTNFNVNDGFERDNTYSRAYREAEYNSFKNADLILITNDNNGTSNQPYFLNIYWVENNSDNHAKIEFTNTRTNIISTQSDVHFSTIAPSRAIQSQGDCVPEYISGTTAGNYTTGYGFFNSGISKIVSATGNIEYSSDYSGIRITPLQYPEIEYSVNDYRIQALYTGNISPQIPAIKYEIFKTDPAYSTPQLIHSYTTSYGAQQPFDYSVSEYSNYILKATPVAPPPLLQRDDVAPVEIKLKIDGYSFASTTKKDCENGVCSEVSRLIDCTTKTAIQDIIGCHISNFNRQINSFFVGLFVPDFSKIKSSFDYQIQTVNSNLGFVSQIFEKFKNLITQLSTPSNFNCSRSFGSFFGSNFNVNFCAMEQNFPSIFNTITFLVRTITVFTLIIMIRKFVLRLISDGVHK